MVHPFAFRWQKIVIFYTHLHFNKKACCTGVQRALKGVIMLLFTESPLFSPHRGILISGVRGTFRRPSFEY